MNYRLFEFTNIKYIVGMIIIFYSVGSCKNSDDIEIKKLDSGYIAFNKYDSLEFDQNLNLISSSVSINDSISKATFRNDSLINLHSTLNNKEFVVWFDSLFKTLYIENEKEITLNQPIGYNIQYGERADVKSLLINFSIILDGHIKGLSTNQYLEYRDDHIDTLWSSFYVIEKTDSGRVFKIFNRQNVDEDYFYMLYYYTESFLDLTPVSRAGNLYISNADSMKRKGPIIFSKENDPFIALKKADEIPSVFQLYVVNPETGRAFHYRLGVVNDKFTSEKGLEKVKNEFSHRFNQFKNKSYFKDIERSLERFSFVNFSNGKVDIDQEELNEIVKTKLN